ncbi:hypothetical protein B566_EDAN002304 [Ephemera danica]|nr:hypothetical protein B566_EDAN002304 [Ephemera danica]
MWMREGGEEEKKARHKNVSSICGSGDDKLKQLVETSDGERCSQLQQRPASGRRPARTTLATSGRSPGLFCSRVAALFGLAANRLETRTQHGTQSASCSCAAGERAWARHHTALLVHVAALDCASSLLLAPLELASLSARGIWWPLPRRDVFCRAALGLEVFLGTASAYGTAALGLHATSEQCLQQPRLAGTTRSLRILRLPVALPLVWTVAGLLCAPFAVFGQLLADPDGARCAVLLPPTKAGGWDRLLLALLRTVFSLAIPLLLLVTCGVRAAVRLCTAAAPHSRLHTVVLLWAVVFVVLSLHRTVFATIHAFMQVFSEHPTHLVPPFVSITSPAATLVFATLHYATCVLRPLLYYLSFRLCSDK